MPSDESVKEEESIEATVEGLARDKRSDIESGWSWVRDRTQDEFSAYARAFERKKAENENGLGQDMDELEDQVNFAKSVGRWWRDWEEYIEEKSQFVGFKGLVGFSVYTETDSNGEEQQVCVPVFQMLNSIERTTPEGYGYLRHTKPMNYTIDRNGAVVKVETPTRDTLLEVRYSESDKPLLIDRRSYSGGREWIEVYPRDNGFEYYEHEQDKRNSESSSEKDFDLSAGGQAWRLYQDLRLSSQRHGFSPRIPNMSWNGREFYGDDDRLSIKDQVDCLIALCENSHPRIASIVS